MEASTSSKMDIVELSKKMEGNLLGSKSPVKGKRLVSSYVSPIITRSKTNSSNDPPLNLNLLGEVPPKKRPRKVDEVEAIYLNKKGKTVRKKLETIYEDPVKKKGCLILQGTNKIKRSIFLNREFRVTSQKKSRLRKSKMRRLGKKTKPCKISDDEFRSRMSHIEKTINEIEENKDSDMEVDDDDDDDDEDEDDKKPEAGGTEESTGDSTESPDSSQ